LIFCNKGKRSKGRFGNYNIGFLLSHNREKAIKLLVTYTKQRRKQENVLRWVRAKGDKYETGATAHKRGHEEYTIKMENDNKTKKNFDPTIMT
jgi:hypothetical protein